MVSNIINSYYWRCWPNICRCANELPLTHEFLAVMLSVRRAGVTKAMNLLESRGLVGAKRGIVIVLDRAGLKAIADGLYGIPEAEYRRLIGWRAKDQR